MAALRVYIAGPMSGIDEMNFPAFHAEAARLRGFGLEVVNPAEINVPHPGDWKAAMRADTAQLVTCDAICLLAGWEKSRGAVLEKQIADALEMRSVVTG